MNNTQIVNQEDLDYELLLWSLSFDQDKQEDKLNTAQIMSSPKSESSDEPDQKCDLKCVLGKLNEQKRKRLILDSPEPQRPQQEQPHYNLPPLHQSTKRLKIQKLQKLDHDQQETCPICLNEFEDLKIICQIAPCKHLVCQECIKKWAEKYKASCPFCRVDIKNIWTLTKLPNGKLIRGKKPLQLDLTQEKWVQEFDQFYFSDSSQDDPSQCMVCHQTHTRYLMLVCDRCDEMVCHTFCDPAILDNIIPTQSWYCLNCRQSKFNYKKAKKLFLA